MVIVSVHHGIGNQMFQYAYARALSLRHGVTCKLDVSWCQLPSRHRDYGLDRFHIALAVASPGEVARVLYKDRPAVVRRALLLGNKLRPNYRRNFVHEDLSRFDPKLLEVRGDAYVYGYFGTERYFSDAAKAVRSELTVKGPVSPANAEVIARMADCQSVCLSVRRGDFVGHPLYDVCGPDYFERAADAVAARVPQPHFFVFSDDNAWVRANLGLKHPHTFVAHNYPDFYEDLRLMTHCRHYVIPNSTFSWWGAWLSRASAPVVVAPERWLNLEALKLPRYAEFVREWCSTGTIDLSDVYPRGWMTVAN
jgi:hypothetical protein